MMTTSAPTASCSGQPRPNGPRTPTIVPGRASTRARVTAPTARMVCTSRPPGLSESDTDTGTSPIPNA
jgi:hypothetical protein